MYFNPKKEGASAPQENGCANSDWLSLQKTDPVYRANNLLELYDGIGQINFELTRELGQDCIEEILEHWLPDGELKGRQYVSCNPTRDDQEPGSFQINIENGVWADFATDESGGGMIDLIMYLEALEKPTDAAIRVLKFIAGMGSDSVDAIVQRQVEAKAKPKAEIYTPIMPIPNETGTRTVYFGSVLGNPTATWEYRNAFGQVMFYVHRFKTENGKSFLPQTYCEDSTGHRTWRNQAPPVPRPPYGLDRLAANPKATVLFTEGEKSADAAQRLFPEFVCMTTMNGSQSPEKSDFTALAGRVVYIAPDNDEAGTQYKDKLIKLLSAAGAEVKSVMKLTALERDGKPLEPGYDLADAEADGWTSESLAKLGDALWEAVGPVKPEPPKKESPIDQVHRFARVTYQKNLAFINNQFRAYNQGYWPALDQKVEVERPALEFLGDAASPGKIGALTSMLAIAYAEKEAEFERNVPLICVLNGTLNPLDATLVPHSPGHRLTNGLNIAWDPAATCPIWLQTLDEIFQPDADRTEKIQLLQEYMGYCMTTDTRLHKFLWMVGAGGNGKSLILDVLTNLVGRENISFAQIERLQEKFVRAELCGKLVNISSEMSAQATISDGYLKQIVAGDIIEAERKHQPSFHFKPCCKMIGATNELPRLLDHSDGFFRRAMILTFNRQFKEAEQDRTRGAKLNAELPGILKWAVEGLQRLMSRAQFEIPPSSAAEVSRYRTNSDPIRQFVDECLVASDDRNHFVTPYKLHGYYQEWCKAYGYQAASVMKLSERLKVLQFEQIRSGGNRFWKIDYTAPAEYCRPEGPLPERRVGAAASKYIV
jgi:putative DNA primase/helicase